MLLGKPSTHHQASNGFYGRRPWRGSKGQRRLALLPCLTERAGQGGTAVRGLSRQHGSLVVKVLSATYW